MNTIVTAQQVCCVCNELFDRAKIELEEIPDNPENKQLAVWSICPEHKDMKDKGFLHFVVVNNKPADMSGDLNIEDFDRTGVVMHIHIDTFKHLFKNKQKVAEFQKSPLIWMDIDSAFQLAETHQRFTQDSSLMDSMTKDLGHLRPRDSVTQLLA